MIIIVLCLILDSRQNSQGYVPVAWLIVLCLILDSRQNYDKRRILFILLYCALFWIQGKTQRVVLSDCRPLYCALFWIQDKINTPPV